MTKTKTKKTAKEFASALEVASAAQDLYEKMTEIESSESYKGVWIHAAIHGMKYMGDTWMAEKIALGAALKAFKNELFKISRRKNG